MYARSALDITFLTRAALGVRAEQGKIVSQVALMTAVVTGTAFSAGATTAT